MKVSYEFLNEKYTKFAFKYSSYSKVAIIVHTNKMHHIQCLLKINMPVVLYSTTLVV